MAELRLKLSSEVLYLGLRSGAIIDGNQSLASSKQSAPVLAVAPLPLSRPSLADSTLDGHCTKLRDTPQLQALSLCQSTAL